MSIRPHAAAVRFENVSKTFGGVIAVRDVSFTVEAGTLVTLLGPSGCGKTTTLRLIAGLELPTSGRIFIGERDVTRMSATERDVSMVFQSYALFPHMTVAENVAYGLTMGGLKKADARARAEDGLALVGLKGYGERLPSELSGGQQQRVAVARALVLEPQVILFDEPLSNLDAKLRRRVRQEIRELQQQLKLTSVYVTHDQAEALAVSDRIIVMRDAVIAQAGTPREIYERPIDDFVADFIGDANLIPAEVVTADGARATVRVGELLIALDDGVRHDGPVSLAVRPDAIHLDAGASSAPAIAGTIRKAAYLGGHLEYVVDTPVGALFVIDRDVRRGLPVGRTVAVRFADHGVHLVRIDAGDPAT